MHIRDLGEGVVELRLYGDIGGWLSDGVFVTAALADLETQFKRCVIRLHSYGGSVTEGNVIANALMRTKMKVEVVVDGIAASMAAIILAYLPADSVSIAENGFGMIHRPSTTLAGDADDLVERAKLLRSVESVFAARLAQRTGLSVAEVRKKWLDGKDHWLDADEMVSLGLAGRKVQAVAEVAELDKAAVLDMGQDEVYSLFEASLKVDNNTKKQNEMDKGQLIAAFGLNGVTAASSDAEVLAALQARHKATEDRAAVLEAKQKADTQASLKVMLDAAGIPADGRKTYEDIADKVGIEAVASVLEGRKPAGGVPGAGASGGTAPLVPQVQGGASGAGGSADDPKTFSELVERGTEVLAAWRKERRADYVKLYKAEFGKEPAMA